MPQKARSILIDEYTIDEGLLKVRLQSLSPATQVESQLANARLTKPRTICAGAMTQSVEFNSLTGIPEVQRLSETVREDARSGQRHLRATHLRKK